MDCDPWNLSNLFRSPFGPSHFRNNDFGPSRKNIVPMTPSKHVTPMIPEGLHPWRLPIGPLDYYYTHPSAEKHLEETEENVKKQYQKIEKEVKQSMCQCGKNLVPIVVEVSFKLKNPEVTYVGDIFIEYCPACQDEQLLALACKNASHKFLTQLTQKK